VQVPHSKGIANHTVPESCVKHREVLREALTGVRVGQPLSREIILFQGADALSQAEGNMYRRVIASTCMTLRGLRPWHARMLFVWEPGDLLSDQLCKVARIGKVRSRSRLCTDRRSQTPQ
jgi:hypothetical protein